ncbi:hypothetical protein [Pseudomonas lactis]|uniref:hypothetical protein n=1 Tax=Pseudomonas lactis TaxID=1615674 RepID=UPI003F7F2316
MISEKRITPDDYMTKPMYIKMYKKMRAVLGIICLLFILITLGISATLTMFLFDFFEPTTTMIVKYLLIALNSFEHSGNLSEFLTNFFISSNFGMRDIYGLVLLPIYLGSMFINLFITAFIVHMCLETAFGSELEIAEPYKYLNDAIDESI